MAGNKILRADIIVGGKADGSLMALGNQIAALGNLLNPISSKLIAFGKESVKAFAGYEDAMLDAQAALRTQYSSTTELNHAMEELDKAALQWANDSRFSTADVAGAISEAAHAGWDLEKMLTGVPSAMKLSLAGGMDLSQGLQYMVDISNAAGISFRELGDLTDYWAYAANKSSTTIPEMGEAMQKMGATTQFVKGDMAALTTMLSVLANNGQKGTEAGTLLRNTMLRLIAPTKAAAQAMDELNISADELDDIYKDDSGLEEANKFLKEMGFSAYDAQGNLKSFLDIFEDLNKATKGMTEQDRYALLSSIFPTRTINGALALLRAADQEWNGLYEDIQTAGKGYADYVAQNMERGLGGTLRHMNSVYNTLQTRVGKNLSGEVGAGAEAITGMLEAVNGMNDRSFTALVDGLGALALAGPAMTAVGGAMKFLPELVSVLSNPGAIGAGLFTVASAAWLYISQMQSLDYKDAFGKMEISSENVSRWLNSIDKSFQESTSNITKYAKSGQEAIEKYSDAAQTLQETAIGSMLSGKSLTDSDRRELSNLGEQMRIEILNAISSNKSESESAAELFGDNSEMWDNISETMEYGFQRAITEAESLSARLREAITSAFSDGKLNPDEIINIQSIIDKENELISMNAEAKNATERAKLLHDAQTLGISGIERLGADAAKKREEQLATVDAAYWQMYENIYKGGLEKIKSGARNSNGNAYTMDDLNAELAEAEAGWQKKRAATSAEYDKTLLDAIMTMGGTSDFSEAFNMLAQGDINGFFKQDKDNIQNATKFINNALGILGGIGSLAADADYLSTVGDPSASAFKNFTGMVSIVNGLNNSTYLEEGGIADRTVNIEVTADASEAQAEIDSVQGKTVYIDVVTRNFGGGGGGGGSFTGFGGKFAEGGRADEASIFGEAGPEWAIPESHTARTAELLRQAAQASGFAWPELMGGGSSGGGYTLVYSPTIYAQNADGVAARLKEDKANLERYLKEKKWIDSVEVYQ